MEKGILLDYKNKRVSYEELVEFIEHSNSNQIAIKNVLINEGGLNELELKFEDRLIYYIEWSKILIIKTSITTEFVKSYLDSLLQCFVEFDIKAHDMMDLMATTFNIDLDDSAQIWDLKRNRSKNQRGQINSSWDYHFHGAECAFKNNKTGQHLDIKIIYGREYGVIDNFFLYRFIETTKSLAHQFDLLDGKSHNLRKVINVLKREGYLINRSNDSFEKLILNRTKKEMKMAKRS